MKSKQNLVQSTTVWLFTYNLSNDNIFSLNNIFTDDKSLVQWKTNKVGYLDKLAPHYFHSAREHWGQVGCTTILKNETTLQFPESLISFPSCLVQVL